MARPPIVISNGGIAEALTIDLVPKTGDSRSVEKIIMDNVANLNLRQPGSQPPAPVAKSLSGSNKNSEPRIYWRLEGEAVYTPTIPGSKAKEIGLDAQ